MRDRIPPTPRPTPGLGPRLFAAQLLVAGTAIAVAWLVAVAIGPSIFHGHLTQVARGGSPEQMMLHAERAYREANGLAVGAALVSALGVAVVASLYVTRRISTRVTTLARAAEDVAEGRYAVQVPRPGLGREFDLLAGSFRAMADQLNDIETTRRRLLGDLAHELRTPVATIDAYLEGIEDGVATLDADTTGMLRHQTRRLARLAEDVAAVSRAEEHQLDLNPVRVAPERLATATVAAVADRYAEAGVDLRTECATDVPDVSVDLDRMGQVLANLLDNALRHTSRGGVVTVSAGRDAAGGVRLEVSDTGSGIPAEHLRHLFERFYRVDSARDRAHGGSGIGLAIVKAVVEAHGGRVAAASAGAGAGASFTVSLPAAAPGPHGAQQTTVSAPGAQSTVSGSGPNRSPSA